MTGASPEIVPAWEAESVRPPAVDAPPGASQGATRRVIGDPALALPSHEDIEASTRAAYERGVAEGRSLGLGEAVRRSQELCEVLVQSMADAQRRIEAERRELMSGLAELAVDMAQQIAGRTPHDGGAALVARLRETVAGSPNTFTRVRVAGIDQSLVAAAVESLGITVDVAPEFRPGEAELHGDWASASLTLESITSQLAASLQRAADDIDDGAPA